MKKGRALKLMVIRLELVHQHSFGHPFYQYELALKRRREEGCSTIFLTSKSYRYPHVIDYLRADFLVLSLPKIYIQFLSRLRIISQRLVIDPFEDYSVMLGDKVVELGSSDNKNSLFPNAVISTRSGNESDKCEYAASLRDFTKEQCRVLEKTLEGLGFCVNSLPPKVDILKAVDAMSISIIKNSMFLIGTNSGP
jgi:hypothetical protein